MSKAQQSKGAEGERELAAHLRRAGYSVEWGGSMTYGTVPDISGLPHIHIEVKRRERLNLSKAMGQAVMDAGRFRDGAPAVFHRKNEHPWLVTMRLRDWLALYGAAVPALDQNARDFFIHSDGEESPLPFTEKGDPKMYWEKETPIIAETEKNVLEYYPQAKKLAVGKPMWTDKRTGESKRGKTVVLDLESAVKSPEAVTLLVRALADFNITKEA